LSLLVVWVTHFFSHALCLKDVDMSATTFMFKEGVDLAKLDSKWDPTAAWAWLWRNRNVADALAMKHGVDVHDICLSKGQVLFSSQPS
jgi:hypothetical protein